MGILRTDKISGLETEKRQNPNLITNGDFSDGTTGWTLSSSSEGSMTVTSGQLVLTNNDTSDPPVYAWQAVKTEIGASYVVSCAIDPAGTASSHAVYVSTSSAFSDQFGFFTDQTSRGQVKEFTATTSTTYVILRVNANSASTSIFDDVVVRKVDGNFRLGSVHFDADGDYLDTIVTNIGNANFTFEMWINTDNTSQGYATVFEYGLHNSSSNGIICQVRNTGGVTGIYTRNGTTDTSGAGISSPYPIKVGEWNHIAITRDGTTVRFHVNGIYTGSGTWSKDFTATDLRIASARYLSGEHFDGYISNFRMLKGTALYTNSDFTVPTHKLEVIKDTIILCCNNPDSVGAEGTGKTITSNGNPTPSTFSPSLTRDFTSGTEFRGVTTFDTQGYFVPPSGTTEQRGRGRGVFSAGTTPNDNTSTNNIDYITIATLGNSQDFGDTTESLSATSGGSDSTRGLFSGGVVAGNNTNYNTISYITIATTSNAVNFGDLSALKRYSGSTSDKTRTVIAGGANAPGPVYDTIEYVTTQSLGDAQTFGDLPTATWAFTGTASSPTRGIYFGGSTSTSSSDSVNTIVYVTIQTLGDALDFGDLTNVNAYTGPGGIVSSTTRGIRGGGGGANPFTRVNTIDYVTIATTGNAQDFGDLSYSPNGAMGCSSLTRGIFAGGKTGSGSVNTIEYVTIATTGNAQDFGDMRGTYAFSSALSDCHGGIS